MSNTETVNTTRSVVENTDANHNLPFTSAPNFELLTTMKVCRACLATNVKLYLISEHKLSAMYERVIGVEINAEDLLPKMLCWECVARLSSANNFIDKAFKSHWLLFVHSNGGQFITMSDIESINKAQYQLESTLGFKRYEVNNTDLHIQWESDNDNDPTNVELLDRNYENRDTQYYVPTDQIDIDVDTDPTDVSEQQQNEDFQVPKPVTKDDLNEEEVTIDSVSNISEASKEEYKNKKRKVCGIIKQKRKRSSASLLSNRSKGASYNKELKVALEDVMLSIRKQNAQDSFKKDTNNRVFYFKAQSIKNKESTHPPINKESLLEDNIDNTNTIKAAKLITPKFENRIEPVFNSDRDKSLSKQVKRKHKKNTDLDSDNKTHDKSSLSDYVKRKQKKNTDFDSDNKTHDKSSLSEHVKRKNKKNTDFDSDDKTHDKTSLSEHVKRKKKKNTDFDSDDKTHDKSSLNEDVKRQHEKNTDSDNKTHDKSSSLSEHVNVKHSKNTVFDCSNCDYKTHDKNNLRKHIKRKHNKNTVFDCSDCDFKSHDKSALNKHVKRKHATNTVYNYCSYCDYKAYDKSHLNYHINAKHTKNAHFDCAQCDYKTYDKSSLRKHVNAIHNKNTVFDCSYCDFKTNDSSSLRKHVNAKHTKNTVYKCSYCPYSVYDKNSLNRHINSKHTKNTVYKCSFCTYSACDKNTFNKHINSKHTKNIVYNCSSCSYKAFDKNCLRRHIYTKH